MTNSQRQLVLIGGGTCAGKSRIVRGMSELSAEPFSLVSLDAYAVDATSNQGTRTNFDHPDSLDLFQLISDLDDLIAGRAILAPSYDFEMQRRTRETCLIQTAHVIIVDGHLALCIEPLRERASLLVFVSADTDIRFARRVKRDVAERGRTIDSVAQQWEESVAPMHLEIIEPSSVHADIVLDGSLDPRENALKILGRL